ncbi:glycosyltransferase [Ferrimonas marina]|uniref:Glycosyltransferase involved in cell wall bisynthesis n=1 Tax=Ferrimonas marina TaxID=299255 RepID=A0A1M5RTP2_9GAMM|nr:glycosyltransferase [Ferrimonas marina]SHH29550.1 Glycosyltransferase involved in cell wall bisynthesis [Ferrimonas marina]
MANWIQVVQHLKPGGIELMALDLLADDPEQGWILALEGDRDSAIAHWPQLAPLASRLLFLDKAPGWQPGLVPRLMQLMRDLQIEAVHTHHIGPLLYAGVAARLAGVPKRLHTEHDAWHLQQPRRRRLEQLAVALAQPTLVADADAVAQGLRQALGRQASPLYVIKNGVDTDRFCPGSSRVAREALGLPQQVPLIGCAGRLEWEKGQDQLVAALVMLPPDVHLALAGSGSQQAALARQCAQLGVAQRVHLMGNLAQMPQFYKALDLYCAPSRREGLSLSILEAQACGIAAVVTDVGASAEALCRRSGALVPSEDVSALAMALNRQLNFGLDQQPRQFVELQGNLRQTRAAYAALRRNTQEVPVC